MHTLFSLCYFQKMSVNHGEAGNCYEIQARKGLRHTIFDFKVEDPRIHTSDGTAHIIHPADIGTELHKLIFTDCPSSEIDNGLLMKEWKHASRPEACDNSDRSTIVGVDAVVIPKWASYISGGTSTHCWFNNDCIRRNLYIAEIKLKIDGIVDAATMGATAHRAWAMEASGRKRNWMVVTDDDHLAAMLKNPKSRGLVESDSDAFYTTVIIKPDDEIVQLRKTVSAASFDLDTLTALVNDLKNQAGADLQLSFHAQRIVDHMSNHEHRRKIAAEACAASKKKRHEASATRLNNEQRKANTAQKRKLDDPKV